jgi:segregation and condensation protein B
MPLCSGLIVLDIKYQIEALLFVAPEPIPLENLATTLNITPEIAQAGIDALRQALENTALIIVEHHNAYKLVTAPAYSDLIKSYLVGESKNELSRAALETLAIIAYKGPVTKTDIEQIRGVSSDTMLRNLIQRGLIVASGKAHTPGRPSLYSVSHEFLQHFGLTHISELPPIEKTTV